MATYVEMHGKVIRIETITENCKRCNSHLQGNACEPASTKIVLLRIHTRMAPKKTKKEQKANRKAALQKKMAEQRRKAMELKVSRE